MLRWVNMPPVWTLASMAVAWGLRHAPGWPWLGGAVMVAALALFVWAVLAFRRARTTIIPGDAPSALVDTGPFHLSRNPIYVADCLLLAGWCLAVGAFAALPLVLLLAVVLDRLFIRPEENILDAGLGAPYRAYRARVRRWL